jgi:WS/DGAT/MGAT family acyltransferase
MAENDLDIEFEPRMSDADALMWSIEKDPLLRSTITTVFVLDRMPDHRLFRRRMDRVSRLVPRLRQRVLGHPMSVAPPRWEIDPNFDLDYHLRWVRAAGDGTRRDVLDLAAPIAMQGFDRARPLWEFTVVEGLADEGAAVIAKIHHSITDGVGGVKLLMELLDLERLPETEPPMPLPPQPSRLTERRRMTDALQYEAARGVRSLFGTLGSLTRDVGHAVRDPVGAGMGVLRTATSLVRLLSPSTAPLSPLMTSRSLSVHFDELDFPIDSLKKASKVVSGRLNDAFVAGVAGGLRRYHEKHGCEVDSLRMTMPINVRNATTANVAGNQFVPARFPVPVGIDDPIERMAAIRLLVEHERAEPALMLTDAIANVLNRLPATATTSVFGGMLKCVDFVTSNVPGPPIPVYMAGARVDAQYAFGPMTGAATSIVLLSHRDQVHLGITTDPAAIPDPDTFVACLRDSFEELCALG